MNVPSAPDESSFLNFVNDTWTRSLDCSAWMQKFESHQIPSGWSNAQLTELKSLFDDIVDHIMLRVKINGSKGKMPVDAVQFHSRYGWVVSAEVGKAYLGKVEMPDNTPVSIGRQSYISGHATLRGQDPLSIGAFSAIAEGIYLNTSPDNHPFEYASMLNFSSEKRWLEENQNMNIRYELPPHYATGITIGNDVWIGREVRLFHGASIANGVVIGERSLVRGSTEPYGIYLGTPAKLKRFRFSEKIISDLLEIQWWNWSDDRILRNRDFFSKNLNSFTGDLFSLVSE